MISHTVPRFLILSLLLSLDWCESKEEFDGLLRKRLVPGQSKSAGRTVASSDPGISGPGSRDLSSHYDITKFWSNQILMLQSLPTVAPTAAPTTQAPTPSPSPNPTLNPITPIPTITLPVTSPPTTTFEPSKHPTVSPTVETSPTPTIKEQSDVPSQEPSNEVTPSPTPSPVSPTSAPVSTPAPIVLTQVPIATPAPIALTPSPTSTPFSGILSLQNTTGVCENGQSGVGCSEISGGSAGNPNDLVNCFNISDVGGQAPFFLDAIRFWIGISVTLPSDLSARVWSANGGRPAELLQEQSLTEFTTGMNMFNLTLPSEILVEEFCVGLNSASPMGGLRIQNEPTLTDGGLQSFVLAPQCGVTEFETLAVLTASSNFCIEAFVSG